MTAEGKSKKVAEHAAAEKGLKLLETYSFVCSTTSPIVRGNFALPVVVGRQQESQNSSSSSKAAATFSKNEVGGLSSELQQMLQQSKVVTNSLLRVDGFSEFGHSNMMSNQRPALNCSRVSKKCTRKLLIRRKQQGLVAPKGRKT